MNNYNNFNNFNGMNSFSRGQAFPNSVQPSRRVDVQPSRRVDVQPSQPSKRTEGGKFEQLKASLLSQGRLYEDPEFQAGASAITRPNGGKLSARNIVWKRPREMGNNPRFIYKDASRFDLDQGQLKDCWFIAATACLAASNAKLLQRCVPPDQEFDKGYAGIFRFNFWYYDKWVEVIVDDRLPTSGGRLFSRAITLNPRNTGSRFSRKHTQSSTDATRIWKADL